MGSIDNGAVFDARKIPEGPADPIYSTMDAYEADTSSSKVNLSVGAYRDGDGKPWIIPVVQKAEKIYHANANRNHEYLPIAGIPHFTSAAQKLVLGAESPAIRENRVCSFQAISGTGALHLGAALLSKFLPRPNPPPVYISSPSWPTHDQLFSNVNLPTRHYSYFNRETKLLDFDGITTDLSSAPRGSVVVLHSCAHNPTGVDPTRDQWVKLAELMRANSLFPFFDCAYQGFASGDLMQDNAAIRLFVEQGFPMLVAQSFAKNMGLYGQRVGALHFIAAPNTDASDTTTRVASQLAILQRSEISSPPIFGAEIASIILNDGKLFADWETDLRTMSGRIIEMRKALRNELERLQTPGTWNHVTEQIGMFSFTGLSPAQVLELRSKWHVYMSETGRMSVAGLNAGNVKYFAEAVDDVVRRVK